MENFAVIDKIIYTLLKQNRKNFVIYPFGPSGYMTKQILNVKYGIQEKYILDQRASVFHKDILALDDLNMEAEKNNTYLVTNQKILPALLNKGIEWSNIVLMDDTTDEILIYDILIHVLKKAGPPPESILDADGYLAQKGNISRVLTASNGELFLINSNRRFDMIKSPSALLLPAHYSMYDNIFDKEDFPQTKYDLVFKILEDKFPRQEELDTLCSIGHQFVLIGPKSEELSEKILPSYYLRHTYYGIMPYAVITGQGGKL